MLSSDDLVTGEAVALDLPPASVATHVGSGIIDVMTMCVVAVSVLFLVLVASRDTDAALQHVALVGTLMAVFLVYPTTMETLTRGKSLGKLVLGLRVVRDRVRLSLQPPVPMPPALADWAARADLRTPPVGLGLAVRQYLTRLPSLDPAAARTTGEMLANRLSAYVAPPPPPGTQPWEFLAAASAARRDRDLARLHRDESLRARLVERHR